MKQSVSLLIIIVIFMMCSGCGTTQSITNDSGRYLITWKKRAVKEVVFKCDIDAISEIDIKLLRKKDNSLRSIEINKPGDNIWAKEVFDDRSDTTRCVGLVMNGSWYSEGSHHFDVIEWSTASTHLTIFKEITEKGEAGQLEGVYTFGPFGLLLKNPN